MSSNLNRHHRRRAAALGMTADEYSKALDEQDEEGSALPPSRPPVPSPLTPPIGLLVWMISDLQGILTRSPPPIRLLGWDGPRAKGIKNSKVTIYRKIKHRPPLFPRPVYPGKSPAWLEHEIDLYILWLIAQRDASTWRRVMETPHFAESEVGTPPATSSAPAVSSPPPAALGRGNTRRLSPVPSGRLARENDG